MSKNLLQKIDIVRYLHCETKSGNGHTVPATPKMTGEVAKEFEAAVLLDFIHFKDGGKKKLLVLGLLKVFWFWFDSLLLLLSAAESVKRPLPPNLFS